MKHALILTASLFALAACGDTSGGDTGAHADSTLRADCLTIANDPEGQDEITEMGTDAEGFCGCAETYIANLSEEERAQATTTMHAVATGMDESGEGTEDVVGRMMEDAMSRPDDEDAQATSTGIRLVGQMIDEIGDGFEETGSCPAS